MKIIQNYDVAAEQEIIEFISKSHPIENVDFKLVNGKENAGWVDFYFKYSDTNFKVTMSLALDDLTKLVEFFASFIDLKEAVAIFLEDENISEPLIFVSPIDDKNIRFLVADGREIYKKWGNGLLNNDKELELSDYEIRCDVIINKKELLKDFVQAINNILKMYEENKVYDIGYDRWGNYFDRILKYIN